MAARLSGEQLEAFRMIFNIRRRHRYDEQSRRIETSSEMAPNDLDRKTFAYNDHGDVISEISESSHAEYDLGEGGELTTKPDSTRSHRSETQFRYQYDPHGNWIEKIVETPGGPIWSIERRTISYFD
jgi:YD repeat-containing protein